MFNLDDDDGVDDGVATIISHKNGIYNYRLYWPKKVKLYGFTFFGKGINKPDFERVMNGKECIGTDLSDTIMSYYGFQSGTKLKWKVNDLNLDFFN